MVANKQVGVRHTAVMIDNRWHNTQGWLHGSDDQQSAPAGIKVHLHI
jgi:hypothetical protein